jgi:hypothetical protein
VTVIHARPTLYKGIRMRSRLEADFAAWLDREGEPWEYEPECFASPAGQWLPDFRIGSWRVLTELKPAGLLKPAIPGTQDYLNRVDEHLRRMTIAWASSPDARLRLVFWTYGGPAQLEVCAAHQGAPWWASASDHMPLLWPGMGQHERLTSAEEDEDIVLATRMARGHWQCSCGCDVQKEGIQPKDVCPHLRALGNLPVQHSAPTLKERWPSIVGGDTAEHTTPGELADHTFTIYADSTSWATHVRLLAARLVPVLNEIFGPDSVHRIKVRRGQ